jgi:hypothetical protein
VDDRFVILGGVPGFTGDFAAGLFHRREPDTTALSTCCYAAP